MNDKVGFGTEHDVYASSDSAANLFRRGICTACALRVNGKASFGTEQDAYASSALAAK